MYQERLVSRSEFVRIRTLDYHVRVWGEPGAGKVPLVMVHGWMDVSASYQFVVDAFARDHYVIAPDWRGYGLTEKRFSLFNTSRWADDTVRPTCCSVVPELHAGPFDTHCVETILSWLRLEGSRAAPGFMRPEGVVVFHPQSRALFKKTLEKDDEPKSKAQAA